MLKIEKKFYEIKMLSFIGYLHHGVLFKNPRKYYPVSIVPTGKMTSRRSTIIIGFEINPVATDALVHVAPGHL